MVDVCHVSWSGEEGLELGKLDLPRAIGVDLVDEVFNVYRQPEIMLDYLHQGPPEINKQTYGGFFGKNIRAFCNK